MATTPTALMPIDPARSAQQATRLLPIRANLLPVEITSSRNARRIRLFVACAAALVVLLLGLWYLYAVKQKSNADTDLATATEQVQVVQKRKNSYRELTATITEQKAVDAQLKTLLKNDLPWASTLDTVRTTGAQAGAIVEQVNGSLITNNTSVVNSDAVATLMIGGAAPDKRKVANFVDALGALDGFANPYLTSATQDQKGKSVKFSLTVELTTEALCGRYTTACKTGGN